MRPRFFILLFAVLASTASLRGQTGAPLSPQELLARALQSISGLLEPGPDGSPRTFSAEWSVSPSDALPKELAGARGSLAIQGPDRVRLGATVGKREFVGGRIGQELWIHVPARKFGVIGKPGVPRFRTAPEKLDRSSLAPLRFPISREQLALLPLLCDVKQSTNEWVDSIECRVLSAKLRPEAVQALKIPSGTLSLWIRPSDTLPLAFAWADGKGAPVRIQLSKAAWTDAWAEDRWRLPTIEGDRIETTAVSHLTRSIPVLIAGLNDSIPELGPAKGERRLLATEGKGRLEMWDGTRVLFLEGTPEEMGRQQGVLVKKQVRDLVDKVLYGVGVGSSFEKGRWFFGEIEDAQARLNPFIDSRHLREMDALAMASQLETEEIRLANFFPELFHWSGFAVFGGATQGGTLYHGRVLDYLRGVGLEQNAVVTVVKPDQGNAWINVGYAGFIGSVTAMNEKKIAIGEMGGRGEGHWDGKPMAQLVREVMERASTLDEAVEIMRKGPRTCEYYYVISDGQSRRAVGIAATPSTFETILPGQSHPRLPHAIADAVLMSAGDRYEALAERVKGGHGRLDATGSRDLMKRPVCMGSNIHSALFAPETLDLWVANADSKNVASHARYTHYNLAEMLQPRTRAPSQQP